MWTSSVIPNMIIIYEKCSYDFQTTTVVSHGLSYTTLKILQRVQNYATRLRLRDINKHTPSYVCDMVETRVHEIEAHE